MTTTKTPAAKVKLPTSKSQALRKIGRTKAADLIKENGPYKIFSVDAITKKRERTFTGRLTAPSKVKGTVKKVPNVSALGMLRIYDMVDHSWKTVNLQTMYGLRIGGEKFKVQ